jgi:SAM-dependent methyltransferase
VDFFERMAIAHADHVFCNPLSSEKLDELVGLLGLSTGARVLDIATGKAEVLRRIVRRFGCTGVGVDLSRSAVAEARQLTERAGLAHAIEIVESDGARYPAQPDSFDVALCLGASWIFGGHEGTLGALARLTRPGGSVIVGEPHWRVPDPSPEYLAAMGMKRDQFGTHAHNVETGERAGLRLLYTVVSSPDDWDRYEGLQWRACERWAQQHPDHPDVAELRSTHYRDAYLRFGRDQLGWAAYLFSKPAWRR